MGAAQNQLEGDRKTGAAQLEEQSSEGNRIAALRPVRHGPTCHLWSQKSQERRELMGQKHCLEPQWPDVPK